MAAIGVCAPHSAFTLKRVNEPVYRLLETLEEMQLVIRDRSSEKWRPTLHTKSLSSGFRDEDWVCQIAIPKMIQMARRILWPIDLMTMREYRMEVRESTHSISPYAINHGMVGRKLPIPETASGRAHLAFASSLPIPGSRSR
ncbi:hypothetical protein [Frigidibacter oleivorans]|uniref:hypothetical protein n=1 Tax=Frigidibacter oleivorans TaxID=2487129 RepID=UPI0013E01888|nr:hypothetical protein [Frigidibacter oleivorans]